MSKTKQKNKNIKIQKTQTKHKHKHNFRYKTKLNLEDYNFIKFTTKTNKCIFINKNQLYILYLYFGIMSKIINKNIELNHKYNLFYSKNEKNKKC